MSPKSLKNKVFEPLTLKKPSSMTKLPFDEWIKHFPDATESEHLDYLNAEIDSNFTIRTPKESVESQQDQDELPQIDSSS
jgi:hypothetical protein